MKKNLIIVFVLCALYLLGQTIIDSKQYRGSHTGLSGSIFDFASAARTRLSAGTTLPATCEFGDVYTKIDATATNQIYVCTNDNPDTWTAQGGGASSSDYPYATAFHSTEEFEKASTTSATMGWAWAGGTLAALAAEANHPGIMRRTTSATINTVAYFIRSSTGNLTVLPADTFNMTWIARVNTSTAQVVRMGLNCGSVSAAQPAAGLYFQATDGGNWFAVNRTGNVETGTAQDTTIASGTGWNTLSVRRSGANAIFAINGTDRITQSANFPTAVCNPWAMITNTEAVDKTMDLDVSYLKVSGMTR